MRAASLLVLRHAVTTWNLEGRLQGQEESPLASSSISVFDRRALMQKTTRHRVISSPLKRCVDTARAVFDCQNVAVDRRLIERNYADLQGRLKSDLEPDFGEAVSIYSLKNRNWKPSGGESWLDVQSRVRSFVEEVRSDTVAISHSTPIQCLLDMSEGGQQPNLFIDNGTLYEFAVSHSREGAGLRFVGLQERVFE